MNWDGKIAADEQLGVGAGASLVSRLSSLLDHQKRTWPLLAQGYESLSRGEMRPVEMDGTRVFVQHNPGRVRSTGAAVDIASVEARPCFLCPANLPPEEKGIEYGDGHVILCNPFPVLDRHLSIVCKEHAPQQIAGNLPLLLELAHDLSPDYFVLYNGPECGASAPDHFHLQACSRSIFPLEAALATGDAPPVPHCDMCEETVANYFELFTINDSGRSAIVFRAGNWTALAAWMKKTLDQLGSHAGKEEPPVNIIATYDQAIWTVFMFPRKRHRPGCFYAEGEEKILVSPGAIDMAGVLVAPERDHFLKLDADLIRRIYSEVSLDEGEVNGVLETVCSE